MCHLLPASKNSVKQPTSAGTRSASRLLHALAFGLLRTTESDLKSLPTFEHPAWVQSVQSDRCDRKRRDQPIDLYFPRLRTTRCSVGNGQCILIAPFAMYSEYQTDDEGKALNSSSPRYDVRRSLNHWYRLAELHQLVDKRLSATHAEFLVAIALQQGLIDPLTPLGPCCEDQRVAQGR